ncbi:hypothetical protein MJN76_31435, partial [Salmonella enterica subsp. enterica serovar Anatum]|nr:hypothetical protein [Salmonella enterica subsp. enterica serovar Anatum]
DMTKTAQAEKARRENEAAELKRKAEEEARRKLEEEARRVAEEVVRFVHHNIPDKKDIPWLKNIVEVLKGNEHKVADVGKYNAGQ